MEQDECFTGPKTTTKTLRNDITLSKAEKQLDSIVKDSKISNSITSTIASGLCIEYAVSNSNSEDIKPTVMADDVSISNKPGTAVRLPFLAKRNNEEKRRKLEEEREKKRLAEEEYNRELSERRYKRLMHLLDKSQFYANLILKKKDGSTKLPSSSTSTKLSPKKKLPSKRAVTKKVATKRKIAISKENSPPPKRPRRNVRPREHDLKDYLTCNITRKLRDRRNLKKLPAVQDDEQEDNSLKSSEDEVRQDMEVNLSSASSEDPAAEAESKEKELFSPPKYFDGELRDYQIEGLKWLKVLHENGLNGILADEMGLGKTIQVIALFCYLIENRQSGPFLIIAPLSTIPNWLLELDRFAPNLPVVLFHGPPEERSAAYRKIKQKYLVENGYKTQPIVITTYDVPFWEKHFLQSQKWRYIVIDEGHRIKNHQCQLVKVLKTLKSMNRLLLTGTPLQNNLAELWSLLNFLLPEIFNDLAVFESWFDVKELQHEEGTMKFLQQEEEKKVVASLREILKPFMLRRVKTDVCLDIPAKKEIIIYAPLTELQRDLYKAVLNRDLQTLCKIEDTPVIIDVNGVRPKRQCVLRKSCDAIYSNALQASTTCNTLENVDVSSDTASVASNDSLDWKPNEFEKKMMLDSNIANSLPLNVNTASGPWTDFVSLGQVFKEKSANSDGEKPSTSSSSSNFVVEQKVEKLISVIQNPTPSCSNINNDKMNLERVEELRSMNKAKFVNKKAKQENKKKDKKTDSSLSYLKQQDANDDEEEIYHDSSDENYFGEKDSKANLFDQPQDLMMWKQYTDVNERNREFLIHITFGSRLPMYKKIVNHPYLMHCPLDSVGLPMIDEDLIKASGKLMVLDQMLAKLKERRHKVLLFSTWIQILDILEDYLSMRSFLYVRLDGTTKIEKRKENISIFNSDPNVFIFLISTRAGGVGLNLAGADTVIIYDSDWNPQVDIQAMARCHRIGQTKPVAVYRFCTKGTIDEEIMKRADVKRKLEKMVISKKDIGPNLNNKETLLKLKQLLESNDCQVASSEKDVFTEEELEKLLDRRDIMAQKPSDGISSKTKKSSPYI